MTEISPLEQLHKFVEQNSSHANASRLVNQVTKFVNRDLQGILGDDGEIAIVIRQGKPGESRPQVYFGLVCPWEVDSGVENARKVNRLIGAFYRRIDAPMELLQREVGIFSPLIFGQNPSVDDLLSGEEKLIGLVSPRMLRVVQSPE